MVNGRGLSNVRYVVALQCSVIRNVSLFSPIFVIPTLPNLYTYPCCQVARCQPSSSRWNLAPLAFAQNDVDALPRDGLVLRSRGVCTVHSPDEFTGC